jgi:predicted DCC family thiol-disulfide oxidoreductase YuxK
MVAPPPPVATLIYDGECAMCRASALWIMRRAMDAGALEILPCRSAPRRERFPQITDAQCMTAMQLVLPDGRVLAGADAMPELLRCAGGGWLRCSRSPACGRSAASCMPGSRATGCGFPAPSDGDGWFVCGAPGARSRRTPGARRAMKRRSVAR